MRALILLSDMWGSRKWSWMKYYEVALQDHFQIYTLDVCKLGEIDLSTYEEKAIHEQFKASGIDIAVEKLLDLNFQNIGVIGFSVGGTIAWRAIQEGLKVCLYYGVSATRLRYESSPINCPSKLFYGQKDAYQVSKNWLETMQIPYKIIKNGTHDCYQNEQLAKQISKDFILNFNSL